MKATATARVAHKTQHIPTNLSLRVTGAFYGIYGLAALAKLWQVNASGHRSDANLFAAIILASFVVFGAVLTLSVESFSIDTSARRYTYRKGIWPFVRTSEGPLNDVQSVQILRSERVVSDGESGQTAPSPTLSVRIAWNVARPATELFSGPEEPGLFHRGSGRERILARATRIASALGCAVDDRSEDGIRKAKAE